MIRVRVRGIFPALALAALSLGIASPSFAVEIVGAPRPNVEREGHTATRFGKGRVLLVGGRNASGPVAVAEIYDPVARTFTVAGNSLEPRSDHAAVVLSDGRVLIMGGRGRDQAALSSTEFFDAIISIDSFMYYGTDDLYLSYLARFLKPGGKIGIVSVRLM